MRDSLGSQRLTAQDLPRVTTCSSNHCPILPPTKVSLGDGTWNWPRSLRSMKELPRIPQAPQLFSWYGLLFQTDAKGSGSDPWQSVERPCLLQAVLGQAWAQLQLFPGLTVNLGQGPYPFWASIFSSGKFQECVPHSSAERIKATHMQMSRVGLLSLCLVGSRACSIQEVLPCSLPWSISTPPHSTSHHVTHT